MRARLWRRSEDNLTGWFFSSVTWVLGIEIRSSGLAASALSQLSSNLASLEGHNFLIWWTGVPLCLTPLPSPPDQIFKSWSVLLTRAKATMKISSLPSIPVAYKQGTPSSLKGSIQSTGLDMWGASIVVKRGSGCLLCPSTRAVSCVWPWHLTTSGMAPSPCCSLFIRTAVRKALLAHLPVCCKSLGTVEAGVYPGTLGFGEGGGTTVLSPLIHLHLPT